MAEKRQSHSPSGFNPSSGSFATAMACHLALDRGLAEATPVREELCYRGDHLRTALGPGNGGQCNHLYRMGQQRRMAGRGNES